MDYPDLSGEQFKKLVNLAKLIAFLVIGGITLISSFAIYFTYNSVKDLKEEVRTEIKELEADVNRFLIYSQNELDRVNRYSEKQIKYITDDAVFQAKKSAQKEVELFFANDIEIKSLVRNTAGVVLGRFEKEVNDLTLVLPEILIALDKIGNDKRIGIEKIIKLKENSKNHFIKKLATEVFEEKRNDFYTAYNNKNGFIWSGDISLFLIKIEKDPSSYFAFSDILNNANKYVVAAANSSLWANRNKTELIQQLIDNVKKDDDLNVVALSFFVILEMTDINCSLFDFDDFVKKSKSYEIKAKYRD